MKIIAVVQARMSSTRFPGKVMRNVQGRPLIDLLLDRLSKSTKLNGIIVATTTNSSDDEFSDHVISLGYPVFRGSEEDVLDRYYQASRTQDPTHVVRITADCPLIDSELVDQVIDQCIAGGKDYATNGTPATYPDGLNVEIATFKALETAWRDSTAPYDREHVTPYLRDSGRFEWIGVTNDEDLSSERWTVDEPEDLEVVGGVFDHFSPDVHFGWRSIIELGRTNPELFAANRHLARDEGAVLGKGQKLWKRAKRTIPGGSMLLSKRAEMFLPKQWPSYFSRAKGARVWDLDGHELLDMSFMGIGTNTLGYGHPEVDAAVMQAVHDGNLSTLNCPEEVTLAERLIELHPWAEMVRFTRSGGEANAVAIRIARAAAGRDKVAFCGYHGWHDWYLSANLAGEGTLAGHLLPGLSPKGVPQGLRGTSLPFSFNNLAELEALLNSHEIGVICMEVMRNSEPEPGFLESVRRLATARNIVLIFDECTSGFRQTFGGIHSQFGVEPDMAVFGKTLGNGYAINAVIGRRSVMDVAQETFISSTFWTERIGPAAALQTLKVMSEVRSWDVISTTGRRMKKIWTDAANRYGLPIKIQGLDALASFSFVLPHALACKTLLTQVMLTRGILGTTAFYACTAHSAADLALYAEVLDDAFALLAGCESAEAVEAHLNGPVCHSGFARLN